jgi:hypothetical protein
MRGIQYAAASRFNHQPPAPSLRATGSRERAPDDRLVAAQRKNGLLRCARNDGGKTHLRLPATPFARALQFVSPQEKRAQGTPGACCTRGLACKNAHRKRTRAYRYSRSIPASLRNGFTAYAVLSPATNSSCHRHRRIKVLRARLGSQHLRRFDTSNGCQDHTVLPYASAPFVWRAMVAHGTPALRSRSRPTPLRPPHLIPTFVTTADAPRAG